MTESQGYLEDQLRGEPQPAKPITGDGEHSKVVCYQGYTNAQREEFRTLAEPLVKWLQENGDPHKTITITYTRADLHSGEFGVCFESPD